MKFFDVSLKDCLILLGVLFGLFATTYGAITVFATNESVIKIDEALKAKNSKQDEAIKLVGERLDKKILQDQLRAIEQRIWLYEDKCGEDLSKCDQEAKDTLRRLRQDRRDIERKLKEGA